MRRDEEHLSEGEGGLVGHQDVHVGLQLRAAPHRHHRHRHLRI